MTSLADKIAAIAVKAAQDKARAIAEANAVSMLPEAFAPYIEHVYRQNDGFTWVTLGKPGEYEWRREAFTLREALKLADLMPDPHTVTAYTTRGCYSIGSDRRDRPEDATDRHGYNFHAEIRTDIHGGAEAIFYASAGGQNFRLSFKLGIAAYKFRTCRVTHHLGRSFYKDTKARTLPGACGNVWSRGSSTEYPADTTHLVYDVDAFLAAVEPQERDA